MTALLHAILTFPLPQPRSPAGITGAAQRPACALGSHRLEVAVHSAAFLEQLWSLHFYLGSITQGTKASPSPL